MRHLYILHELSSHLRTILRSFIRLVTGTQGHIFRRNFTLTLNRLGGHQGLQFNQRNLTRMTLSRMRRAVLFNFVNPAQRPTFSRRFRMFDRTYLNSPLWNVDSFTIKGLRNLFSQLLLLLLRDLDISHRQSLRTRPPRVAY